MAIRKRDLLLLIPVVALCTCLGLIALNLLHLQAPLYEVLSEVGSIIALGSEPGWRVEMHGAEEMNAILDYGDLSLSSGAASRVVPLTDESVLIDYSDTKPGLSVILIRGKCTDDMKGDQHDLSVVISYGNNTYTGCSDFIDER